MHNAGQRKRLLWTSVSTVMLFTLSLGGLAIEDGVHAASVSGGDIVNVVLPTVSERENSPFNFILDPQGLIYETGAIRYGGGVVEEGATLLFRNSEGAYDFSRASDMLTVTNQSNVPVAVSVSAYISECEEFDIVGTDDFAGNVSPGIYLALTDNEGNVWPLPAEGETSIAVEMAAASSGESTTYSFGLTGACNPNASWQETEVHPIVAVTWHVNTMQAENVGAAGEEPSGQREPGYDMDATVSGNDAS